MGKRRSKNKIKATSQVAEPEDSVTVAVTGPEVVNSPLKLSMPSPSPASCNSASDSDSDLVCCKHSSVYGRYLETKKSVKKGTLLISENALVVGPMRSSNVTCVGCHAEIEPECKVTASEPKTEVCLRCSKCRWPICSMECMDSLYHRDECKFFENKIKTPELVKSGEFGALAVLRALLLKLTNPPAWELLNTLEHHNDIRKKLPLWEENERSVVKVIQDKWKLRRIFSSDEEIHTVCGILEVNSFELGDKHSFRGLFPRTAMLAHNCAPNATQFIHTGEGKIDVRAAVDLPMGTPIYLSYAMSLQGTALRQKSLLDIKFFECQCDRCLDPTELGTHLSTLKCHKCKIGLLLQNQENGKSSVSEWVCTNKCGARIPQCAIDKLITQFYTRWEKLDGISSQERFLADCEPFFHPNHYISFRVKFDLCQAYGREGVASIHELSQPTLERKAALCTQVLAVLDKITPGHTIARAWALYELQAAELVKCKRIFEDGDFETAELRKRLMNAMKMLLEAIGIFGLSDTTSVEFKIARAAKQETLIGLQSWIDCLH